MKRKTRLRNARPKAFFGALESGATLAAAGINAAATLTAAGISAAAQAAAADKQASSIQSQAEKQAEALNKQNENNNKLQEKNIETQQQTSNKIADAITNNQLNLAMQQGAEDAIYRNKEGLIQVKYGGNSKMKKRRMISHIPLTGNANMPFKVTDGGEVAYKGSTPEGYDLYEIFGDNHEQYHKNNKKYKSGVGFKFANGGIVEGEGNGKSSQGELLLNTPDGGYFISKHTNAGFNPALAVENGMSPVKAFNIQEDLKAVYGIPGHRRNLRNMARFGGRTKAPYGIPPGKYDSKPGIATTTNLRQWYADKYEKDIGIPWQNNYKYPYDVWQELNPLLDPNNYDIYNPAQKPNNINNPSLANANINNPTTPTALPEISITTPKTEGGNASNWKPNIDFNVNLTDPNNKNISASPVSLQNTKSSFWDSPTAAFAINAGANLLGLGANYLGNRIAASKLTNAYNKAAGIMSDAYGKLQTIDVDGLEDLKGFRTAVITPITRSANIKVNSRLQDVNRAAIKQRQAYRNSTLSDAARLNRSAFFENQAQDQRDRIYEDQENREEQIKQANNQAINEAAAKNVQARNEMTRSLANLRLELAKYNNDIVNERILGAANAQSQMGINAAGAKANAYNAIGNSAANTLNTIGNNAYNIWQNKYNTDRQYLMNLSGSDADATVRSLAMTGRYANRDTILRTYNSFVLTGDNTHARQIKDLFPQYFKS